MAGAGPVTPKRPGGQHDAPGLERARPEPPSEDLVTPASTGIVSSRRWSRASAAVLWAGVLSIPFAPLARAADRPATNSAAVTPSVPRLPRDELLLYRGPGGM